MLWFAKNYNRRRTPNAFDQKYYLGGETDRNIFAEKNFDYLTIAASDYICHVRTYPFGIVKGIAPYEEVKHFPTEVL